MGDPRDTAGPRGPSWWDVGRLTEEIRTRHDVAVQFFIVPHLEKGRGVTGYDCFAQARLPKTAHGPPLAQRHHGFRGNGGASTIAAALWMALSALDEALSAEGGQMRLPDV